MNLSILLENATVEAKRASNQALTDLNQEARKRKRILPQNHPPPIPNQLAHTPPKYGNREGPRLISNAQHDVNDHCNEEKRNKGTICR